MATWMLTAIFYLLLADSSLAGDDNTYTVETDEDSGEQILFLIEGDQPHEIDRNVHVTILQQADFDGDGAWDVLVSTDTGGSCCPPEYAIHSWVKGADKRVGIECDREPVVVEGPAGLAIRSQTIEKTTIAVLRNGRLETIETIPQLKAIKELHSPEGTPNNKTDHQILKVDINDDGKLEEIRCEHWEFHESMVCTLPLPNGDIQETHLGCKRFGMLAAKSNDLHQFVCDNDILFLFDGYRWDISSPEIEVLAERIRKLEPIIGNFPPAINNDTEKNNVKKEYEAIKAELDVLLEQTTYDSGLHLHYLRGSLQGMGHNFDYPLAAEGAVEDFQAVLKREPNHILSLLDMGRLLVNSRPELAPDAEKLFLTSQCAHGNKPLEEAQRGLFFALYYQGRMAEALRQANYLATIWPKETQYQKLVDMTNSVIGRANESGTPLAPLTGPLGLEGCQK